MALFDLATMKISNAAGNILKRVRKWRFSGFDATYDAVNDEVVFVPTSIAVLTGLQVTELATTPGTTDGEVRACNGYATSGDGGGGVFSWEAGVSAGSDGFLKINAAGGQWRREYDGALNIAWFGAVGDGDAGQAAANTAAIQAALDKAPAQGETVLVPRGTFVVNELTLPVGTRLRGVHELQSVLKAASKYSGGNTPSGTAPAGVLRLPPGSGAHSITIENLSINGGFTDWSYTAAVDTNHMRHGIYLAPGGDSPRLRVSNVRIYTTTGSAVYATASVFESTFERVYAEQTGHHCFYIYGGNTLLLSQCTVNAPAHQKSGYYFEAGNPTLIACNGLYHDVSFNPVTHKVTWGSFGETGGICRPVLLGCNVESFSRYGLVFGTSSFPGYGNLLQHSEACVARPLKFGSVNGVDLGLLDGSWRPFLGGGSSELGDPDTAVVDGDYVESTGMPYISLNNSLPNARVGGVQYPVPRLSAENVEGVYALRPNRLCAKTVYANQRTVTANYTVAEGDHHIDVDASAGPVTVSLATLSSERQREIFVAKIDSSANPVTVDPFGGHTINGKATLSLYRQHDHARVRGIVGGSTNWTAEGVFPLVYRDLARDHASVAAGGYSAEVTLAVTGAALGDHVDVTSSVDLQGLIPIARVSAADTVKYGLFNPTAGAIDLDSADFYLMVKEL